MQGAKGAGMKVVYCAYGARKYADQLAQSVASLKAVHPEARVYVHSTPDFVQNLWNLPVTPVISKAAARPSDWHDPLMKVRAIVAEAEEPFLYLDNDTYVAGSLAPAWELLSNYDCLGVHSPIPDQRGFLGLEPAPGLTRPPPEVFPEWNGGVLFFAGTDGARRIARNWLEWLEKKIPGGGDQWPLAQAVWQSGARMHVLPNSYNCRLPACPSVYGTIRILHDDRPDLAQVANILNADQGLRQVIRSGDSFGLHLDPAAGARCF